MSAKVSSNTLSIELNSSKRKIINPLKIYMQYRKKKRLEIERKLLLREATMKEDLERFLMEIEDRNCWIAYQLNHVNHERLKKKEIISKIEKKEMKKQEIETLESMKENGLSFFRGEIKSYKRWQNSGAKHLGYLNYKNFII